MPSVWRRKPVNPFSDVAWALPTPTSCNWKRNVVQNRMTKLLEKAIAQARALPPEDQDALAAVLLSMTDEGTGIVALDDETRAAIREGLEQARRGEFVPDAEIEALWKRFGL
jgi:predicted transcriptional regulator